MNYMKIEMDCLSQDEKSLLSMQTSPLRFRHKHLTHQRVEIQANLIIIESFISETILVYEWLLK